MINMHDICVLRHFLHGLEKRQFIANFSVGLKYKVLKSYYLSRCTVLNIQKELQNEDYINDTIVETSVNLTLSVNKLTWFTYTREHKNEVDQEITSSGISDTTPFVRKWARLG